MDMFVGIKQYWIYSLLLCGFFHTTVPTFPGKGVKRPYTILTYMAGDNDLEPYIQFDLFEMKQGAHENAHVLAFVSTHKPGEGKYSKKLVITGDGVYQDGPELKGLDSGHPSTAITAGLWALTDYPSDYFVFICWDHGTGPLNRVLGDIVKPWNYFADPYEREKAKSRYKQQNIRGICYDDSTGSFLDDFDLRAISSALVEHRGKKIDIWAFDACLMASAEIGYMLMPYVSYLVASQEVISRTGFEYKLMLQGLRDIIMKPRQFAHHMIESFGSWYSLTSDSYTLSALDLNELNMVVDNVNKLSDILAQCLQQQRDHEIDRIITSAGFSDRFIRFLEPDFIDLYSFYANLWHKSIDMPIDEATLSLLQHTLLQGMAAIERAVVARVSSPQYAAIRGISIYLPRIMHSSYRHLYWCIKTNWCRFLDGYVTAISQPFSSGIREAH